MSFAVVGAVVLCVEGVYGAVEYLLSGTVVTVVPVDPVSQRPVAEAGL